MKRAGLVSKTSAVGANRGKFVRLAKQLDLPLKLTHGEQVQYCKEKLYGSMLQVANASFNLTALTFCPWPFPGQNERRLYTLVQRLNASEKVREWAFLYNTLVCA
jgi:hypothetical protein